MTKKPEIVVSEDGRNYSLEKIKRAWITSGMATHAFARAYSLKKEEVERLIAEGSWEEEKHKYKMQLHSNFAWEYVEGVNSDQMAMQLLQETERQNLLAILNDINEQEATLGHRFVLDANGDIRRDSFGNPIVREVPKRVKEAFLENVSAKELTTKKVGSVVKGAELIPLPPDKSLSQKLLDAEVIDLEKLAEEDDEQGD